MSDVAKQGITVCMDVQQRTDDGLFRIAAADEILRLVADAHETEFTIAELVEATGAARSTVWRAVDLLESTGAIRVRETPQRNYVSIDQQRLQKDDPLLAIEQPAFRAPIREFVSRLQQAIEGTDEVDGLIGVIVFGSVARGEADRRSDIDLFVVVEGDRTSARQLVADLVADLSERRFDGDRFAFEPYVESEASAHRARSKLEEIFTQGVTVYGDERIQTLRKAVFANE